MLRIEIDDIKKLDKLSLINVINFLTSFVNPVKAVQQDTPVIPLDPLPEIEHEVEESVSNNVINTFPELMNKITMHIRERQLTAGNILEILKKFGLEHSADLATRTDLIPIVATEINKRIWGE